MIMLKRSSWLLVVCFTVLAASSLIVVTAQQQTDNNYNDNNVNMMTCNADDGTCHNNDNVIQAEAEAEAGKEAGEKEDILQKKVLNENEEIKVSFVNMSPYRIDLYWDDGMYGQRITTIEAKNGQATINTFIQHSFFVTQHGRRVGLFNLENDTQYRFIVTHSDEQFIIPTTAAPSNNTCQDRFSSCTNLAQNGGCFNGPGW